MNNLPSLAYDSLLSGSGLTKAQFQELMANIIAVSSVLEGIVAPTFKADKHQQYFDTVTNKYYRNVDGGTTWVALN